MMNIALDSSLRAAAIATFEQVVFLLPDTPPDDQQRAREVAAIASIAFSGPAVGVLQVRACEGLLPRLTAHMLGEESDDEGLQLDALGELANIICGQLFPQIAPDSAFSQDPPDVVSCPEARLPLLRLPAAQVELGLENSRADVLLYLFADFRPAAAPVR
jgi:hypothetical protein